VVMVIPRRVSNAERASSTRAWLLIDMRLS
jgi:hypothetical protein